MFAENISFGVVTGSHEGNHIACGSYEEFVQAVLTLTSLTGEAAHWCAMYAGGKVIVRFPFKVALSVVRKYKTADVASDAICNTLLCTMGSVWKHNHHI